MSKLKRIAVLILVLCLVLCGCGKSAFTPKNEKPVQGENTPEPVKESSTITTPNSTGAASGKSFDPDFYFSTMGLDGRSYTQEFFAKQKLTMINFWEPWCGPCVGELPEIEELYNEYKSQGFAVLGVFSTEDGAEDVVSECELSFPCIFYDSAFDRFQSGYVPTTIFVDGDGHVVGESYVGAKSYADWAAIVESLL